MKKILVITLFAILQTNLFAACVSGTYRLGLISKCYSNYTNCTHEFGYSGECPATIADGGNYYKGGHPGEFGTCHGGATRECQGIGTASYQTGRCMYTELCSSRCDTLPECPDGSPRNETSCECPPPPCQIHEVCITYWNTGAGVSVQIDPNEITTLPPNYSGSGYYAMKLFDVDSCQSPPRITLKMDVPGTCEEHGYCDPGENQCTKPKSSSSAGSSSSSYEPPDCVCMGCFGGNCMVTCSDGSNRTCVGDFDNCAELKASPEWVECTAPNSSPSSSGAGSSAAGSSASPSSQDNAIDGINALIDTLHHSNELQEVGHGIMQEGQKQNKGFFDNALGFMAGMMEQVTGIFSNTNKIANNTDNIKKGVNNIANKLDSIKDRPRDTTIVNVAGDTINITGDTNIINIPIDSSIGEPWDTSGGLAGMLTGAFDSTFTGLDTLPNWDTIHRGSVDSIGRGITAVWDSGAGKFYKDTLGKWMSSGIQNSTLSGTGSNSCPAFLTSSYVINIGSISVDLTRNVKLGQYLCTPVFGGRTGWELGRTLLRIIVAIGCMFFLFRCATGTIGGEE